MPHDPAPGWQLMLSGRRGHLVFCDPAFELLGWQSIGAVWETDVFGAFRLSPRVEMAPPIRTKKWSRCYLLLLKLWRWQSRRKPTAGVQGTIVHGPCAMTVVFDGAKRCLETEVFGTS